MQAKNAILVDMKSAKRWQLWAKGEASHNLEVKLEFKQGHEVLAKAIAGIILWRINRSPQTYTDNVSIISQF